MRDICRWCFTDREDIIRRGSFGACGVAGRWYALFRYTEVSLIKYIVLYWFPDSIHIQPGGPSARGKSNSKGPMVSRLALETGRRYMAMTRMLLVINHGKNIPLCSSFCWSRGGRLAKRRHRGKKKLYHARRQSNHIISHI